MGRTGEVFRYQADAVKNTFSLMSGNGGATIRPENKHQLDTQRLDVDVTHPDSVLMLCFCVQWLKDRIAQSTNVRGVPGRSNLAWGERLSSKRAVGIQLIIFAFIILFILFLTIRSLF